MQINLNLHPEIIRAVHRYARRHRISFKVAVAELLREQLGLV